MGCWWNRGLQQDINFTTRYVYKFGGDSSIHWGIWTKTVGPGWTWITKKYGQRLVQPPKKQPQARGNYKGKVIFRHVQIRLVASNKPLMGCGPLPDWLRDKCCIYAIDTFDDNLCVWRCLVIYKRHACGEKNQVQKRNCEAAWNLVPEYYGDNDLKKKDVRPTKLVDFECIAKYHNVNMLYEPKKDRGKDARSIWQLVYGKVQYKNDLPTINMGLLGSHCFYIKEMDVLCKRWECKGCRQIFMRN